jgi:hypothetical protein
VKAHLLYPDQDFDFQAPLPPGHDDLVQDLELTTPLAAMAAGDDFLYDVSARVLLTSLTDAEAIRYRQQVLADCIAEPGVIRQIYAIATGALRDRRRQWGFLGSQNPSHIRARRDAVGLRQRFARRCACLPGTLLARPVGTESAPAGRHGGPAGYRIFPLRPAAAHRSAVPAHGEQDHPGQRARGAP